MSQPSPANLSKREREIMDILYRLGEAGAHEVTEEMAEKVSYDTVRVTLSILEKKGYLSHQQDGRRYIFRPIMNREKASRHAVDNLLQTFFQGSPSQAILAMLDISSDRLSERELNEIAELIEKEKSS
jgi:predicted transcriptional regulator